MIALALSVDIQPTNSTFKKSHSGSSDQICFSQQAIVPVAESNVSLSSYSFQQTISKDNSNQFNDALLSYHLLIVCSLSQQIQWLGSIGIKYQKLVLLFPSHYFW